jgi:hypothetical protein
MFGTERQGHRQRQGQRKGRAIGIGIIVLMLVLAGCSGGSNDAADNAGNAATNSNSAGNRATAEEPASGESTGGESEPMPPYEEERGGGMDGDDGDPQASAGQLTAGEWRDPDEWSRWLNLLNSREGDSYSRHWGYYGFDRLVVTAKSDGSPAVDALVTVEDGSGQIVWQSRTDVNGRAYAFAELFREMSGHYRQDDRNRRDEPASSEEPNRRGNNGYYVEVSHGGESKRFENVPIPRDEPLTVEFEAAKLSDQVDLMFVVDTTGSMQDEIDFLREELKDVIDRVQSESGQQLAMAISTNFYRDRYDDYVVKPYPFTRDVDQAIRQIAKEKASGGGDYPEAVEQALDDALHGHEWSKDARARLLFLVLDAPPHHEPDIVDRLHELTLEAAEQGVRIIPVASSGVDVQTEYLMRFLSAATGGTYVFLTDHSGIGNDHMEPAVGEYEVRPLNDLLVDIIRRYSEPRNGSE